ncbi:MAG: hypothetical protein CMN86_02535 [Stappia sp.]|nr:hypothetical protein [Stappia sp.]
MASPESVLFDSKTKKGIGLSSRVLGKPKSESSAASITYGPSASASTTERILMVCWKMRALQTFASQFLIFPKWGHSQEQ